VKQRVTVIKGDGIGPEVVESTIRILEAANAPLTYDYQLAGADVFKQGNRTGVPAETLESIESNKVVLKGPLETPVGYGEKSANVTLRKAFSTYANMRPVFNLPNITTPFSDRNIDLTVIRENVEDLYAGIEYELAPGVASALKLMTEPGCEQITRFAFEYARSRGKKTVHCATKANILKMTEGLLKRTFERVALDYPGIEAKHIIVDNCAHQLVITPEQFDVIVMSNMNGDILSDLTSGLVGGLGVAASANIGDDVAIFEAVHGSAPDIAGQDKANPTAFILAAIYMLRHLGHFEVAETVEKALFKTLEDGFMTGDLDRSGNGLGCNGYVDKIIANLGASPQKYESKTYREMPKISMTCDPYKKDETVLRGLDIYVDDHAGDMEPLVEKVKKAIENSPLKFKLIADRGNVITKVRGVSSKCSRLLQIRLVSEEELKDQNLSDFEDQLALNGVKWTQLIKLTSSQDQDMFTRLQGES